MFFILSKLLYFLTLPVNWCLTLFLWAYFTKSEVLKKKLFITSIVLLYLFSNEFLSDLSIGKWEFRDDTVFENLEKEKAYEYAIVLGGMTWHDEVTGQTQFLRSGDRLFQAIRLLQQKKIKKIIFTGGSGSLDNPNTKEGVHIQKYLNEIGIPDSSLVIENESNNTHENASFTKNILKNLNYKDEDVLLITSAFHMRRALACFKKAGITNIQPFATDFYTSKIRFEFDHCFLPDVDAIQANTILVHEIIGYICYKVMGYC